MKSGCRTTFFLWSQIIIEPVGIGGKVELASCGGSGVKVKLRLGVREISRDMTPF